MTGSLIRKKDEVETKTRQFKLSAWRIGVLFVLSAFATSASAAWVAGMTIRNVRSIASTGEITFATVEPMLNPNGCEATDFYGIVPADNAKHALAILLAAQATNAKINFYIVDGASGCEGNGRPRVIDVMIGTF